MLSHWLSKQEYEALAGPVLKGHGAESLTDKARVKYTLILDWTETSFLIWTCFDRQLEALWKRMPMYIIGGIDAGQADDWSGRMAACEKNAI